MKTAFVTWITEDFLTSEEMAFCFEHLKTTLSKTVDCFILEGINPKVDDLRRWQPIREFDALLIAPLPDLITTAEAIQALTETMSIKPELDCIDSSTIEDVPEDQRRPYFTMRGFEEFSILLRQSNKILSDYRESKGHFYILRSSALERLSGDCPLEQLPNRLPTQRVKKSLHAYIHTFRDYYQQKRVEVLNFIPKNVKTILDIGCASGLLWQTQSDQWIITGIETNKNAALMARRYMHRVINEDFMKLDIKERFDCILCLDVLEHVYDTTAFVQKVRSLLNPKGHVIISVPNVGHWSVLDDLLKGRWDYVPAGPLCISHKRFFTQNSISALLSNNGFCIIETRPIITELPEYLRSALSLFEQCNVTINMQSLKAIGYYLLAKRDFD